METLYWRPSTRELEALLLFYCRRDSPEASPLESFEWLNDNGHMAEECADECSYRTINECASN